jgi:hypothetical protein
MLSWLVLFQTSLAAPVRHSNPNSRPFNRLQPLCRREKSQLLCNQANPASFSKIPGWGGHPERIYGTPGVGYTLASRPRGLSKSCPLLCVGSAPSASQRYPGAAHSLMRGATIFRINTCKSVSKQMTLTPFIINTYAKQGEGVGRNRHS